MKKEFNYHDSSLDSAVFNFQDQSFILNISQYNEVSEDYYTHQFKFLDVQNINFNLPIVKIIDAEIYSFTISNNETVSTAHIGILLGTGLPSFEFNLDFKNYIFKEIKKELKD